MKALASILVLVALAIGGYFVFSESSGKGDGVQVDVENDTTDGTKSSSTSKQDDKSKKDGELVASTPKDRESKKLQLSREEERRRLWRKLRPTSEKFLPDPDNVGPCPPVSSGARAGRVVKRFLDPANGARVWQHDDGSFTRLAFGVGTYKDARTGRMLPKEIVITQVPTTPVDIAPDELPVVDTPKTVKKNGQ